MNSARLGRGFRAIRVRANRTQLDVATRAGIPRALVGRVERGDLARLRLDQLVALATALHADVDIILRSEGAELDQLLNAGHSAMHETVVGILTAAG
jgi:transcriptional regulator with XRE-family HTH domain